MKNKKGFTLIELLAVIVILAIIALIATPIILNMINQARKNSAKSSALGYIDAIEYNNGFAQIGTSAGLTEVYTPVVSGNVEDATTSLGKHLKGKAPDSGTITVNEKGKVTEATLCINGYTVTYNGKAATVGSKCSSNSNNNNNNQEPQQPTYTAYNPGDELYFDPASTNICDSEHTTSETCYKWRVITVGDDTTKENITVQMDHNLVNKDRWSTGSSNSSGPNYALTSLANATSSWSKVSGLNYTYDTTLGGTNTEYNYGILSCTNGTCKITKNNTDTQIATNVKARLITGEELKALTLNAGAANDTTAGTWTLESPNSNYYYFSSSQYILGTSNIGTGNKSLSWLVENTSADTSSGATASSSTNNGYWTLSPVFDAPSSVWRVGDSGNFGYYNVSYSNYYGLRPVITMPKSVFN